ncbi:MAG: ABC transporter substrate-binding protein [Methylobacterium sp.]|nr:ABC transporter substrate-binding protein [Methylobacterium sp.]MCA3605478.1 ABC transporter substrate-binding protein [Methylobacterium sp.]MCA3608097.1 ABC transporter substrate-binding protein [Methylobacterium sp.]MCA3616821.1 ABC transporter substrate-binding protein [Methylobacterium sp.]MCA3621590.1 ABC transporter substrate-binding protein [Methylobacterium sp.]
MNARNMLMGLVLVMGASSVSNAQEGRLVLYTSQPNNDAQQTIDAFRAKYPKVEISFVRDGTPRLMAKLRTELQAGAPQADVLLIADSVTMEGLKAEGRLLAHSGANLAGYPEGLHDPQKFWFATKLITTGIVYNTRSPVRPESWVDLLRPELRGQLVMPSPLNSGAALIHAATLVGTLPGGWDFYRKLKANDALAGGANGDVLRQVAGGEKLVGMIVDFLPIRERAKGAPVEFVFPKEGVSAVSEPVAVLASTKNPDAAKAFVDFLLSAEGQALAARQGYLAAHPAAAVPAGFPARDSIRLMTFDPAKTLREETRIRKDFADIFGQ